MGLCGSVSEEKKKNDVINKQLNDAYSEDRGKIKILLLGAGESGKSTLFKQMKLLYTKQKSFSSDEKENFRKAIYSNIITDCKTLASETASHTPVTDPNTTEAINQISKWNKETVIGEAEAALLETFWNDTAVQETWSNRGDIQVQDALEYFLSPSNLSRIRGPKYEPNDQDILRSRVRTSGVVVERFEIDNTPFEMHDVGGQRNERRKWIHSFDHVTTVLFVVAISEYNQVLYEDHNVSRQAESVDLFRDQLNLTTFSHIPFILFLNKDDLFREKLTKIPFKVTTGDHQRNLDYEGKELAYNREYSMNGTDTEYEEVYVDVIEYLKNLYESQSPNEERKQEVYTHVTNSTSSENIRKIMESAKNIILKANLENGGWM